MIISYSDITMRVPPNPRPVTPHPSPASPLSKRAPRSPVSEVVRAASFPPPTYCPPRDLDLIRPGCFILPLLPRRGALARSIPPSSPGFAPPSKPECCSQLPDASLPPPPCSCALPFPDPKTGVLVCIDLDAGSRRV
jgi:hypothetical protein